MSEKRILIVGAGISGLCFLHASLQANFKPKVIEKLPSFKKEGMGIALPANAMLGFEQLNLAKEIMAVAYQVHRIRYVKASGALLSEASLDKKPLNKAPFVSLLRSELIDILKEDREQYIEFNQEIEALEEREVDVKVRFNGGKTEIFDLVVIADGLHSTTRALSFKGAGTNSLNVTNWRFLSFSKKNISEPIYYIGNDTAFMIYPMPKNQIYCYAQVLDKEKKHLKSASKSSLQKLFSEYTEEVLESIENIENEENILEGRLASVIKPFYPTKNIILIGDALHGCSPSLQQGVGMGIEDGLVLAKVLSTMPQNLALKEFTRLREKRVDWVVNESNKIIHLAGIGKTFIGRVIRNFIVRLNGPINVKGWKFLLSE